MIAQEVEQYFPELVKGTEESKSLNYQNMTAVLLEAIKEINTEKEVLVNKINNLEKDNNLLKEKIDKLEKFIYKL